jgi:DNA-binding PadR family transcriptional regulator
MHPYEMRRLMRERHKEDRLLLKSGSIYHAIKWLEQSHLVEAIETSRLGKRPERTVYRITAAGEKELLNWLRDLLAIPVREPSSFAVALDHAVHLSPGELADQLEKRVSLLEHPLKEMDLVIKALTPKVGRVNLLEVEFEQALRHAELRWVRQLARELRAGSLTWNIEKILNYLRKAAKHTQPTK